MDRFKGILIGFLTMISITISGQTTWTSLNDIPKKWTKLERDSIGYLLYKPCDGGTPVISIDSGYVTIYWQLDAPDKLPIEKFTRLKGNKAFYINAGNQNTRIDFTAEIKDSKQKLILWTFGDNKWIMTPFDNRNNFRFIDNPCPTEMKPEKQFLPIEY
jgi:hypothetical protein